MKTTPFLIKEIRALPPEERAQFFRDATKATQGSETPWESTPGGIAEATADQAMRCIPVSPEEDQRILDFYWNFLRPSRLKRPAK